MNANKNDREKNLGVNKLKLAGWSFIFLAIIAAVIGFNYQQVEGSLAKSPHGRCAAGVSLAFMGAAGLLLNAASQRGGIIHEENEDINRKDQPARFWLNVGSGYLFWILFLVVGVTTAIRAWPE